MSTVQHCAVSHKKVTEIPENDSQVPLSVDITTPTHSPECLLGEKLFVRSRSLPQCSSSDLVSDFFDHVQGDPGTGRKTPLIIPKLPSLSLHSHLTLQHNQERSVTSPQSNQPVVDLVLNSGTANVHNAVNCTGNGATPPPVWTLSTASPEGISPDGDFGAVMDSELCCSDDSLDFNDGSLTDDENDDAKLKSDGRIRHSGGLFYRPFTFHIDILCCGRQLQVFPSRCIKALFRLLECSGK